MINYRVHQAVSGAPEIDRVVEETKRTPFSETIENTQVRNVGKLRLPIYEGKNDPRVYMTVFNITVERAHLSEQEKEAWLCKV